MRLVEPDAAATRRHQVLKSAGDTSGEETFHRDKVESWEKNVSKLMKTSGMMLPPPASDQLIVIRCLRARWAGPNVKPYAAVWCR